jgi:hypothetical protein
MINIAGMNKAEVLMKLFNRSKQQGLGFLDTRGAKNMSLDDAKACISETPRLYFDYLFGRVLKVDLSKDSFDPWLYDRDNGEGAAERAINV